MKHSKKMVAIADDYVIYTMTGTVGKLLVAYVGITGVHKGQATRSAIFIRKAYHIDDPVCWLKNGSDLTISSDHKKVKLPQALAEEALVTAQLMATMGRKAVRGGPWCRKRLTHDDNLEIEAVAVSSRWSDVAGLVKIFPSGSLARHMRFEDFSSGESMITSSAAKVTAKSLPLFFASDRKEKRPPQAWSQKDKRQSQGRHQKAKRPPQAR